MNCLHFGVCGGCVCVPDSQGRMAPPAYSDELLQKEARVHTLLAEAAVEEWRPMVPSPDEWYYRNKMEIAIGELREMPFALGMRETGRFDRIVDLQTCGLMSPESVEVIRHVREWAKERKLSGYNRFSHQGELRYLVLREGKNTGERLGVLIARTAPEGLDDLQKRLQSLLTTALLGITEARGDVARTQDMRVLWGSGTLKERLGSITYRISPYSFFQTNTHATERLYGLLNDWAGTVGGGALLDLYCGSGGITLTLAAGFDRAIGVDTNAEAIEDARFNAAQNHLGNTEFVTEDALKFLGKLPGSKMSVQLSALIVDPPRPGLHPKALAALIEINPPKLAYVSCNPESLARDLKVLAPLYRIQSVQPIDLFPHTAHVETVCLMEHR